VNERASSATVAHFLELIVCAVLRAVNGASVARENVVVELLRSGSAQDVFRRDQLRGGVAAWSVYEQRYSWGERRVRCHSVHVNEVRLRQHECMDVGASETFAALAQRMIVAHLEAEATVRARLVVMLDVANSTVSRSDELRGDLEVVRQSPVVHVE